MTATTRVWLAGSEITANCEKINFTKCMNSGPQDGTLKCTDLPAFQYNLDRHGDGEDACTMIDPWTKETGDDGDGTDIVHEIDVTAGVHSLHIKDASRTTQNSISLPLPATIGVGKCIRVLMKPLTCTGGSTNCFLGIQLNEGTTIGVHLALYLVNGVIYYKPTDADAEYAPGLTSTGVTATMDSAGYIYIKLESDTQFKISLTSTFSGAALNMCNALTIGWDIIRLYTPDVNDDGGVVSGKEDYESYAHDSNIDGQSHGGFTWSAGAVAGCTAKVRDAAGNNYLEIVDGSDAAGMNVYCTFITKGSPNGTDIIKFRRNGTTQAARSIPMVREGAAVNIHLYFNESDWKVYYYAGDYLDSGLTWSANTWETWEILLLSTTQFKLRKGGSGAWTGALNNRTAFSGAGAVVDQFWPEFGLAGNQYTCL